MSTSYQPGSGPPEDRGSGRPDDNTRVNRDTTGRDGTPGGATTHDTTRRETTDRSEARATDRRSVVEREKEQFGGIKVGSAFFGWLTATGAAVLLTALAAAVGTAVGVSTNTDISQVANQASNNPKTVGIVGGVVLLVILFVAYYCGGYVAGRMARFNGIRQGLAVWIWAVVIAILILIFATVAGQKYDVLSKLNSFPRIPATGNLTTGGVIALVIVAAASLVGALLGGLAGMRFHRNVDKAGLGR